MAKKDFPNLKRKKVEESFWLQTKINCINDFQTLGMRNRVEYYSAKSSEQTEGATSRDQQVLAYLK